MTIAQWIQSVGVLVGVLAAVGALAYFRALNTLVQAQMKTNGGSTLLDKANLIVDVKADLLELSDLVKANHEEGKQEWAGLHDEDNELVRRINKLDQKAASFTELLAPRLELQDHTVARVEAMETIQTAFDARLHILETKAHEH